MTNLKAILQPAYEPGYGRCAQFVDGEWWHPIFGCDSLQKVVDNVRSMLRLPPGYIDPEHQGQDLEMLQAFYQACSAEGGTADEIHLRGIKAALATLQTALPVPSAPNENWVAVAAFAQDMRARGLAEQAHGDELLKLANRQAGGGLSSGKHLGRVREVSSNPAPLPTYKDMKNLIDKRLDYGLPMSDEVRLTRTLEQWGQVAPTSAQPAAIAQPAEGPSPVAPDHASLIAFAHGREPWATWLKRGGCLESAHCELSDLMLAVLARYGRPTFQPIPVSERLPGPDYCCPNPRNGQGQWCWGWVQRDPIPYSGCWRMMRREWLFDEALAWAPWWAFPLPGATEMVGEGQPCSP